MKSSWPKIIASVTDTFTASHSLPDIGAVEPHHHIWTVTAGWINEINPYHGCTKPMQEMKKDLKEILGLMDGKHLNDLMKFPPTSETIACFVMGRLPAYWQFVRVEAYDGYMVECRADTMRSEWLEQYR